MSVVVAGKGSTIGVVFEANVMLVGCGYSAAIGSVNEGPGEEGVNPRFLESKHLKSYCGTAASESERTLTDGMVLCDYLGAPREADANASKLRAWQANYCGLGTR